MSIPIILSSDDEESDIKIMELPYNINIEPIKSEDKTNSVRSAIEFNSEYNQDLDIQSINNNGSVNESILSCYNNDVYNNNQNNNSDFFVFDDNKSVNGEIESISNNLTPQDIKYIQNLSDARIGYLVTKFNTTIKCAYFPNGEIGYYVWDDRVKLWQENKIRGATKFCYLYRAIREKLTMIFNAALNIPEISQCEFDDAVKWIESTSHIRNAIPWLDIKIDEQFESTINAHPFNLPIMPCKILNCKNLTIRDRNVNDYWTFEFKHRYYPELLTENNVFHQFLWNMWSDDEEFEFFRILCGKLLSCDSDENLVMILQQEKGGGGKTVFATTIYNVFRQFCTQLSKKVILFMQGNIEAELCKLRGKRMAFIDEALNNDDNESEKKKKQKIPIKLSVLLDICGGGMISPRDTYQTGRSVRPFKPMSSTFLMGNFLCFDCNESDAMDRRTIICPPRTYYRNPSDAGYEEDDEWCKPKNPKIQEILLKNPNQVFTFMVKAFNEYLMNNNVELIMDRVPARWRQVWRSTFNKQTAVKEFIDKHCIKAVDGKIPVNQFVRALNDFKDTKYFTFDIVKKLLAYINDVQLGHLHPPFQTKIRCVIGLKWKIVIEE